MSACSASSSSSSPTARLLVNEIAPRVHNSGHWTEAVCVTDQFEQHIRAIAGWPLGDPTRLADVVMENLIGDEIAAIPARLGPGIRPHAYGKAESRPGRKMGHLNRVAAQNAPRNRRFSPLRPVDKPERFNYKPAHGDRLGRSARLPLARALQLNH